MGSSFTCTVLRLLIFSIQGFPPCTLEAFLQHVCWWRIYCLKLDLLFLSRHLKGQHFSGFLRWLWFIWPQWDLKQNIKCSFISHCNIADFLIREMRDSATDYLLWWTLQRQNAQSNHTSCFCQKQASCLLHPPTGRHGVKSLVVAAQKTFLFYILNKTVNTCRLRVNTDDSCRSYSLTLIEMNLASLLPSAVRSLFPIPSPDIDESPDKWCLPPHSVLVILAIYYPYHSVTVNASPCYSRIWKKLVSNTCSRLKMECRIPSLLLVSIKDGRRSRLAILTKSSCKENTPPQQDLGYH